ncbi:hypothetical protein [Herpetosiphon geysericola]|uniref:DUF2178 domain-containing protein n=1 Tax=Herpetosiphon geysericola TaxID=70996 RepID=A0A0P6YK33_9CHLR|nr:hypothetical protein [Herpetosiphon geysericola]KPL90981.1 hypothetical protein SE18_04255 [Herpetosiphon geysericola]
MAYREKTAWLSLIALAVAFGPYFGMTLLWPPDNTLPNLSQLGFFGIASVVRMLILGGGYLYLHYNVPKADRMPPDERDRAISQRSITAAYYVLMAGMLIVGMIMPFNQSGWTLVNSALLMIVLAEVVCGSIVVLSYRWQRA